jgi:hypothetical protein|tara:strand:- start:6509 stop:6988 length:480 start_codon:yes stop_codon:yes gene_type:complete
MEHQEDARRRTVLNEDSVLADADQGTLLNAFWLIMDVMIGLDYTSSSCTSCDRKSYNSIEQFKAYDLLSGCVNRLSKLIDEDRRPAVLEARQDRTKEVLMQMAQHTERSGLVAYPDSPKGVQEFVKTGSLTCLNFQDVETLRWAIKELRRSDIEEFNNV